MFHRTKKSAGSQPPARDDSQAVTVPRNNTTAVDQDQPDGLVTIGKGARVTGQIEDCTLLDVYGIVEADVVTDVLVVRNGGGVRGSVQTNEAEIHGVVEGQLVVNGHLDIRSTGMISGEVSYDSMAAAVGGQIRGNLYVHEAELNAEDMSISRMSPINGEILDISAPTMADEPEKMNGSYHQI